MSDIWISSAFVNGHAFKKEIIYFANRLPQNIYLFGY